MKSIGIDQHWLDYTRYVAKNDRVILRAPQNRGNCRGCRCWRPCGWQAIKIRGWDFAVIQKIKVMGLKLRQSIDEMAEGIVDITQRKFLPARIWRQKLDDLVRQGHGPQRHEGDVTDGQLKNRILHGFDPMTGNPVDYDEFYKKYGVHYDPISHGTPPDFGGRIINVQGKGDLPIVMSDKIRHLSGEHATKFNTPADYVRAYEKVMKSSSFDTFKASDRIQDAIEISAKSIFGPNFQARLKGYTSGINPTIFGSGTKVVAVFRKEGQTIRLVTMHPNP